MKTNLKKAAALVLASSMVLSVSQMAFADTYTVVKGDCLWNIAKKYDTTWQTLADINKLANPNLIFPNQVLQLPEKEAPAPVVETPATETPAYDTTWQTLADINKLANPNLIFPNQVLQLPEKEAPAPVVETPATETPATETPATETPAADPVYLTDLSVVSNVSTANALTFLPETTDYTVNVQSDIETPATETPAADPVYLTDLSVVSNVSTANALTFLPETTDYTVNVQSDIYGVKVTATAPEGATLTINGAEAVSGEGTVVKIADDYASYDVVVETPVEVVVTKDGASTTYKINVVRDCDTETYNLFQQLEYVDKETGVTVPYCLYVPTNYDATKKYPVVFALHGSGQRSQSVDMVLKRYQMATVWAKDSEAGKNECIVLAPQCATKDDSINWTTLMQYRAGTAEDSFQLLDTSKAAYNLLLKVMDEYSVDKDRVYMTGLSAGGFATYALAIEHPETFAAIVPVCGGANPEKVSAIKDMPMWIFHAADDPTVNPEEYLYPTLEALDAAGIEYKSTIYDKGTVFSTSAHFSWDPAYADTDMRTWLFEQSK